MGKTLELLLVLLIARQAISEDATRCVRFAEGDGICTITVDCDKIPLSMTEEIKKRERECTPALQKNVNIELIIGNFNSDGTNELELLSEDTTGKRITKVKMINGSLQSALPFLYKAQVDVKNITLNFGNITAIDLHKIVKSSTLSLDISKNSISQLEDTASTASFNSKLKDLDLSHNKIKNIPSQYFESFRELQNLNMSHNLIIGHLSITVFQGLIQLKTLDLSYNQLNNLERSLNRFEYLETLFLNNNSLIYISNETFIVMKQLKLLDLHSNAIADIDIEAFVALKELNTLDVSNNKLTVIHNEMFKHNPKLSNFNVFNNKMTSITPGLFKNNKIQYFSCLKNPLGGYLDKFMFDGLLVSKLDFSNANIVEIREECFSPLAETLTQLNLSNNSIIKISDNAFRNLKKLKRLDLSYNKLKDTQFNTIDLENLESLNFQNNFITSIKEDTFQNLISLLTLDMSNNSITEIKTLSLNKMIKLEKIHLSNNKLQTLSSETFVGLDKLTVLKIDSNYITSIKNNTFFGMKSLTDVIYSHNKLKTIDKDAFKETGSVKHLDLSYNLLTRFSIILSQLDSLEKLYLNDNQLIEVPVLNELINLQELNLARNNILKLESNTFSSLKKLNLLDLSSNKNIVINNHFENLLLLKTVNLQNNLNVNFHKVANTSIINLDLSSCSLINLGSASISNIKNLNTLLLQNNKIAVLDYNSFKGMTTLETLDLSRNQIHEIQSDSFNDTKQLNKLDLSKNKLVSLNQLMLMGLTKLSSVNLSQNKISEIPKDLLQNATDLETLDLHDNQIKIWSTSILYGLNKLKKLNLKNNKLFEFGPWYLPEGASNLEIVLDDNQIEYLRFDEFSASNKVKSLSIGGNIILCQSISDSIIKYTNLNIKSQVQEIQFENFNGIACGKSNKSIVLTATPKIEPDTNCVNLKEKNAVCVVNVNCLNVSTAIESRIFECTEKHSKYFVTLNFDMTQFIVTPDDIKNLNYDIKNLKHSNLEYVKKLQMKNGNLQLALALVEKFKNLQEIQIKHTSISSINLQQIIKEKVTIADLSNNLIIKLDEIAEGGKNNIGHELRDLNLSYNKLTTVPDYYFDPFTHLESLDLSHNSIHGKLSVTFFHGFNNLKTLHLSYNDISNLDNKAGQLEYLEHLSLDNNKISRISNETFILMTRLKSLNLNTNKIVNIDVDAFKHLGELGSLDIANNKICEIRKDLFKNNLQLSDLDLFNNNITLIAPQSFKNNKIKRILLSNNAISSLKKSMFEGLLASELDLSNSKIVELQDECFSPLAETLTQLKLANNTIKTIPVNAFKNLIKLEKLDLSQNQLPDTQFNTIDLVKLETLTLHKNYITQVKRETFKNLKSLLELDISNNQIVEIEPQSFDAVKKLKKVYLNNNNLQKLTKKTFGNLENLVEIKIDHNNVNTIEKGTFSGMKSLSDVSCTHNNLKIIDSEAFIETGAIRCLNLSHNSLTQFSIKVDHLANIKELNLNDNKLDIIQLLELKLVYLETLNLAGNNKVNMLSTSSPTARLTMNIFAPRSSRTRRSTKSYVNYTISHSWPSLKFLDLSRNRITKIKEGVFKDAAQLEELNLNSNGISDLGLTTFFGLHKLRLLDLSKNKLSKIESELFKETKELEILDLHQNEIKKWHSNTLANITTLKKVNLMSNRLVDFGPWYLPKTETGIEVILDENQIEYLRFDEFFTSNKVVSLSIGGNPIACKAVSDSILAFKKLNIKSQSKENKFDNIEGIACGKKLVNADSPVHSSVSDITEPNISIPTTDVATERTGIIDTNNKTIAGFKVLFHKLNAMDSSYKKTRNDTLRQLDEIALGQTEYRTKFDKLASSELNTISSFRILVNVIASFMGIIAVVLVVKSVYTIFNVRKQAS